MPPDPFENELNLANAPVPPSVNSVPPVVFVEGFMGSGKQKNWGPLAEIFKNTGQLKYSIRSRAEELTMEKSMQKNLDTLVLHIHWEALPFGNYNNY
ncbi:alpha/beta hydrolase protein [Rhizophagus irregularis DAOM 181602=DAOM 197198]|nr:alpha/beta hydrolase protein [Rhizophagus irregularis DAOM 181602=DAOM 197198]